MKIMRKVRKIKSSELGNILMLGGGIKIDKWRYDDRERFECMKTIVLKHLRWSKDLYFFELVGYEFPPGSEGRWFHINSDIVPVVLALHGKWPWVVVRDKNTRNKIAIFNDEMAAEKVRAEFPEQDSSERDDTAMYQATWDLTKNSFKREIQGVLSTPERPEGTFWGGNKPDLSKVAVFVEQFGKRRYDTSAIARAHKEGYSIYILSDNARVDVIWHWAKHVIVVDGTEGGAGCCTTVPNWRIAWETLFSLLHTPLVFTQVEYDDPESNTSEFLFRLRNRGAKLEVDFQEATKPNASDLSKVAVFFEKDSLKGIDMARSQDYTVYHLFQNNLEGGRYKVVMRRGNNFSESFRTWTEALAALTRSVGLPYTGYNYDDTVEYLRGHGIKTAEDFKEGLPDLTGVVILTDESTPNERARAYATVPWPKLYCVSKGVMSQEWSPIILENRVERSRKGWVELLNRLEVPRHGVVWPPRRHLTKLGATIH